MLLLFVGFVVVVGFDGVADVVVVVVGLVVVVCLLFLNAIRVEIKSKVEILIT